MGTALRSASMGCRARSHTMLDRLHTTPPWQWPPDTGTKLTALLANRKADPKQRADAARLAGEIVVMSNAVAKALLAVLADASEPEELRAAAAGAFGAVLELCEWEGFDDREAVPINKAAYGRIVEALSKLYRDRTQPKLVRRRILEAAVRGSADWHEAAVREAYSSGDPEWVLTAVFAMQYVRGFDLEIVEALNHADPEVVGWAVAAAEQFEVGDAWDRILELVDDPKTPKETRIGAILAMAAIRPEDARDRVNDFCEDPDEEIAEAAGEAADSIEWRLNEEEDFDDDDLDEDDDDFDDDDLDEDEPDDFVDDAKPAPSQPKQPKNSATDKPPGKGGKSR
jgi:hypothetical protein